MDFMKVFDQTVREIKREVNLKVLKVPEIEQKVLDATDDEPWGPHGSVLAEIAQATKKFSECQMVMNVLWTRLGETGKNWRFVYKSLAVIEYLVANGSERAVDDIIEHTFQISSLSSFEYVEPNGKDNGINVRKKVENILALLNDKDKIQQARNKAAANRDKYVGLSSTGITYKSSSTSIGSGSSMSGDRYGGFGSTKDGEAFRDSYKKSDRSTEDKFDKSDSKSRRGVTVGNQENSSKKASSRYGSKSQDSSATGSSKPKAKFSDKHATVSSEGLTAPPNNNEDDFDDFDPRGLSSSKAAAAAAISPQVDLFCDLMDAPVSVATEKSHGNSTSEEVDLFAGASFVSAPSHQESGGDYQSESKADLFASQPAVSSATSPAVDLFATPNPIPQLEKKSSESGPSATKAVDPFAAVSLNNFDGSDLFGAFTSPAESVSMEPTQNSINDGGLNNIYEKTKVTSNTPAKKDGFQVKSGIWADSLSRGLIDLNISAPKKVNLSDVGIVGGLTDEEKDKGPTTSFYMGRAMGSGTGLGKSSGFTSTSASASSSATDLDDFFSNISSQQNQFGGFQK